MSEYCPKCGKVTASVQRIGCGYTRWLCNVCGTEVDYDVWDDGDGLDGDDMDDYDHTEGDVGQDGAM